MKTHCIFFPFSHISQDQLAALQAFFSSFAFFPASADLQHSIRLRELVDKGTAVPVFVSRDDLTLVDRQFEQYMDWAKIHKGNEHNLRFLLNGNPYFTSDSDLTAIKSQIRGKRESIKPQQSPKEALLKDLLFLKMAEQCDRDNENTDLQLKSVEKNTSRMLSTLLGEDDPMKAKAYGGKPGSPDVGTIMTRERIEAWARCMMQFNAGENTAESSVFATTSEAVFDYLETISSDTINALDIDLIKVHENECENKIGWQRQFFEQEICAAKGDLDRLNHLPEVTDECSLSGQIKMSLFSGNNIHNLFHLKDKQIRVCWIRLKR
ncbi:MAG: hypothetical protein A2464_08155 [Deltaproteobacteria bacterium RIFOXYC2_FULL_48_10]|nr:MAG: hypothetical protein A2464_08155 [Deltaproteobacteria bacterium RIFOXYC2_FULL_48_10]